MDTSGMAVSNGMSIAQVARLVSRISELIFEGRFDQAQKCCDELSSAVLDAWIVNGDVQLRQLPRLAESDKGYEN